MSLPAAAPGEVPLDPAAVGPRDVALLEDLLERGGVVREAPVDWSRWLALLGDRLGGLLSGVELHGPLRWLALTLLAALLVLAVVLLARRRRRAPADGGRVAAASPGGRDPWRRLGEALEAGRVREALSLLWEGIARELRAGGLAALGPAGTPREALAALPADWPGRREFAGLVGDLERWTYGGRPVAPAEVRGLAARARALLVPGEGSLVERGAAPPAGDGA